MPAKRPQCTKIVLSNYIEGTYGTAIDPLNVDKMFEPNEPILPEVSLVRATDAEFIKGLEWAQDFDTIVSQDVSIPFNFPLSAEIAGILYSLALGHIVTTDADPNFVHELVPMYGCTDGDQLPATDLVLIIDGDTDSYLGFKGVVVGDLRLVIDSRSWVSLQGTFQTDGSISDQSAFEPPASYVTKTYLVGNTVRLYHTVIDEANDFDDIFLGAEFTITNNLDLEGARALLASPDKTISELRYQTREYSLKVTIQGHQGDTWWDHYIDGDALAMFLTIGTVSRYVRIDFPICRITECAARFDGMRDILELTFTPWYDPDTINNPVKVHVGDSMSEHMQEEP